MDKKIRRIGLFLAAYVFMFWVGFRSGEIHNRIYKKDMDKVLSEISPIIAPRPMRNFYIVERQYYDNYSKTIFEFVNESDTRIRLFLNRRLRSLLKQRKIKIYTLKGVRIY